MFKCGDCGYVFEFFVEWREAHGELLWGCPRCFGASIPLDDYLLAEDDFRR
ncbi:MAG: hypothetical protein ACOX05_01835 [Bacillota bacterium]